MPIPEEPSLPIRHEVELPDSAELGIFADFANLWHTPATFVLDFLSVKAPVTLAHDDEGTPHGLLQSRVAARVRIPPEQIFPLIKALQTQSQEWLSETGRSVPPETWLGGAQPPDNFDTVESNVTDVDPPEQGNGSQS